MFFITDFLFVKLLNLTEYKYYSDYADGKLYFTENIRSFIDRSLVFSLKPGMSKGIVFNILRY